METSKSKQNIIPIINKATIRLSAILSTILYLIILVAVIIYKNTGIEEILNEIVSSGFLKMFPLIAGLTSVLFSALYLFISYLDREEKPAKEEENEIRRSPVKGEPIINEDSISYNSQENSDLNKLTLDLIKDSQLELQLHLEEIELRIKKELFRLKTNSNLNLIIGFSTTLIVILILFYQLFWVKASNENTSNVFLITISYLPKLSLILIVELFSIFFLRLYKTNLEEIKYLNNEKTNIDFKILSLKIALMKEDQELIKLTVEEFLRTERNFKLGKNETTVELEKMKHEKSEPKILMEFISKYMGNFGK